MATFNPRLSAPSTSDLNWIHTSAGGYNYCIKVSGNSCIPNCTGYAWGRWRELLGAYHNLSRGNARLWYGTNDGYGRGQTPKLGAVACWDSTVGDAGHVAIVEKINSDGSIVTSNSGYNSTRFWTQTIKAPYNIGSQYKFQGFIYLPIDFGGGTTIPSTKISYQSHDSRYGWNPNVTMGSGDYAGNFGYNMDAVYVDRFRVRVHDMVTGQWLPWVQNRNDYAGNIGHAIDGIQMDRDQDESPIYRVHINGGGWLGSVTGYNDTADGYAGIYGRAIDAFEILDVMCRP